jgi:hypothetical protein
MAHNVRLGAVFLTNFKKMKKKFIIQNAIDKKYWYGFYTNKSWTDDILEARLFKNKQEMEDWIENNIGKLEGMFLVAIEVWSWYYT